MFVNLKVIRFYLKVSLPIITIILGLNMIFKLEHQIKSYRKMYKYEEDCLAPFAVTRNNTDFYANISCEFSEVFRKMEPQQDNLLNLRYIIEGSDFCKNSPDLRIISYVHSSVKKSESRQLIRDTWGHPRFYEMNKLKVIFVLGAAETPEEQENIYRESETYNDILQADFMDTYRNLSLKGMTAMKWLSEHCNNALWVLKSDDDMVINNYKLENLLQRYEVKTDVYYYNTQYISYNYKNTYVPRKFICRSYTHPRAYRQGPDCSEKQCVTMSEWPWKYYPTFCSGSVFIFPNFLSTNIFEMYAVAPYLWVDDVYITGIIAVLLNITHEQIVNHYDLYSYEKKNLTVTDRTFIHYPKHPAASYYLWSNIIAYEGGQS